MTPTGRAFHNCESDVKCIMGPIGCLPCDTEVMTPSGWIRIADWSGQEILQWNPESGRALFMSPKKFVSGPCEEMLSFDCGKHFGMTVTANHRVPVYDWAGRFRVKSAGELAARPSKHRVPTTWELVGGPDGCAFDDAGRPVSGWMLRLWVAIAADGNYPKQGRQCVFSLRRERKIERLRMLLKENEIGWTESVRVRDGATETRIAFDRPALPKHLDWRVTSLGSEEAELVLDEMRHWDGLEDSGYDRFDGNDRTDADVIQFLAHSCGRNATLRVKEYPDHPKWRPTYCVHIAKTGSAKNRVCIRCDGTEVEAVRPPDGMQYCFETAFGFFVVRQEGRIFVTGNSGKSSDCTWELWFKACRQVPDPFDGVRRVKFMIVRNTFTELIDTTVRTWTEWFPETKIVKFPQLHGTLRFPHPVDGKPVEIELQFRALDNENQVKDLLSLEVTGCWFNECKELDWNLVFNAMSRRGRYPKTNADAGYFPIQDMGVIMDTNPCSEECWYYRKAEVEKPDGWAFFRQPPGVLRIDDGNGKYHYEANRGQDPTVPPAENCENYTDGYDYYTKKLSGADEDWIKVYLMGEYGTTMAGKVVYPEYSDAVHFHDGELTPAWGLPLYLGTDFGRTPATVIGQLMPDGQVVVYDELCGVDMGIIEFCQTALRPRLATKFRMAKMQVFNYADPAGKTGNQLDNISCIEMMNQNGIPTEPCAVPNNSPYLRWTAVAECLRRRLSNGKAGLVICRPCKMLRSGFLGKYSYRKMATAAAFGGESYAETVDKSNPYSHPHDALQYMVYGATHQGGAGAFDVGLRTDVEAMAKRRSGDLLPDFPVVREPAVTAMNARRYERGYGGYQRTPGGRYSRFRMDGYC